MKSPFRKEPKAGEILIIKLDSDHWCYLTVVSYSGTWLMDFYTDKPTRNPVYFSKSMFKHPLFIGGRMNREWRTVGIMDLLPEERRDPRAVYKLTPSIQKFKKAPTPYQVSLPFGGNEYVTEEEAAKMFSHICLKVEKGELEEYLHGVLPELRRVEVPPEDQWTPPISVDSEPPTGPVIVEVHFYCQPETMGREADEIAEELGDDLSVNGLGQLMTMDSASDDEFEIILEVEAHRLKGAITQIRKTLKRLKAPADTRILEVADTGTVDHPLLAPPKQK